MLVNWIIRLYNWFMRCKPIIRFVIGVDENVNAVIKIKHKTKMIPSPNDLIYVGESGPYYIVDKIIHYYGDRHVIWVMVIPLDVNELEEK